MYIEIHKPQPDSRLKCIVVQYLIFLIFFSHRLELPQSLCLVCHYTNPFRVSLLTPYTRYGGSARSITKREQTRRGLVGTSNCKLDFLDVKS